MKSEWVNRHTPWVRMMHWTNVVCFIVLFMSGLNIFNSNSSLYWGKSSYNGTAPLLQIKGKITDQGEMIGTTTVLGRSFNTTGILGASMVGGNPTVRAFPSWITIPDRKWLALARLWHFFFAWIFVINGFLYILYAIKSRHLANDLAPTPNDWRTIGQSIKDHIRFKHPTGEAAKRYNVLQKIAYLVVIFILLPMVILMGLGMSPMVNTVIPNWVDWFGGRQSARTLHFIAAWALVAFVLVHVFEVIITGLWNNIRSMITGRYEIKLDNSETGAPT
ncbi:MAG: cytochrome b/b6 domain-containing protein [Methylophilaceae bacterium]